MKRLLDFCRERNIAVEDLHASGHADREEVKALIDGLGPAALLPIHCETGEDREQLTKLVRLYGLALEELGRTGPEVLFVLPYCLSRPDKTNSLLSCSSCLFSSYEELLEQAEDICEGPHLGASKWERMNGRWEEIMEFDVQWVNGVFCTTRFRLGGGRLEAWGIDEGTMSLQLGYDVCSFEQIEYPIPFMTGDLVKVDAPMLDEPLYGVMDNVADLNGVRYMWLGYVDGDHLDAMPLSSNLLDFSGGYRMIDWLHSARPEELPEGEEILRKISEHLTPRPRREVPGSDADNEFLDIFCAENERVFRRWEELPFPELLAQAREEREGHG